MPNPTAWSVPRSQFGIRRRCQIHRARGYRIRLPGTYRVVSSVSTGAVGFETAYSCARIKMLYHCHWCQKCQYRIFRSAKKAVSELDHYRNCCTYFCYNYTDSLLACFEKKLSLFSRCTHQPVKTRSLPSREHEKNDPNAWVWGGGGQTIEFLRIPTDLFQDCFLDLPLFRAPFSFFRPPPPSAIVIWYLVIDGETASYCNFRCV